RQKELEEEAARRARLAELGDLAAGVAHEIRNPLNAISLAAQRLDLEFAGQVQHDAEQFRFFTGQIKDESKRLDGIVTRLLDLTRAPKVEIESQPVAEIITDWAGFMRPEIERDKVNLVVTLDESLRAKVDRNKLRQALGNLYRNAHEAFLSGPRRAGHLEVTLELRKLDDHAALIFTDNGPGVTPEIADKMFTPYFTTKENGAGLGLAISYRLIADMGGALELDKTYTDGARFVMTLRL
ncbi:MAG TPA: ATP-binding protein, partial [candidate division Zixibacteria bacterium]|nr:ATP-binding protein [candidate division Zixibacteria bacterium]